MSLNALKHGYRAGGEQHPLYTVWCDMKARCLTPTTTHYKHYGGRGLTVCKQWLTNPVGFINWALHNGWQPGLTIERKDNSKGYSPQNCTWATRIEQSRNTRHTKLTLARARQIRALLASGVTQKQIGKQFGVTQANVSDIKLNNIWKEKG
jgi:hypothetical protein